MTQANEKDPAYEKTLDTSRSQTGNVQTVGTWTECAVYPQRYWTECAVYPERYWTECAVYPERYWTECAVYPECCLDGMRRVPSALDRAPNSLREPCSMAV